MTQAQREVLTEFAADELPGCWNMSVVQAHVRALLAATETPTADALLDEWLEVDFYFKSHLELRRRTRAYRSQAHETPPRPGMAGAAEGRRYAAETPAPADLVAKVLRMQRGWNEWADAGAPVLGPLIEEMHDSRDAVMAWTPAVPVDTPELSQDCDIAPLAAPVDTPADDGESTREQVRSVEAALGAAMDRIYDQRADAVDTPPRVFARCARCNGVLLPPAHRIYYHEARETEDGYSCAKRVDYPAAQMCSVCGKIPIIGEMLDALTATPAPPRATPDNSAGEWHTTVLGAVGCGSAGGSFTSLPATAVMGTATTTSGPGPHDGSYWDQPAPPQPAGEMPPHVEMGDWVRWLFSPVVQVVQSPSQVESYNAPVHMADMCELRGTRHGQPFVWRRDRDLQE